MKCTNCGNEIPDGNIYCPSCGCVTASPYEAPIIENPIKERLLFAFKDDLYLIICIFISCYAMFSFFLGSLPILQILFTIFLWLIYGGAQKGNLDTANMRRVSGTVFAGYVLNWILVCCLAFLGVISFIFGVGAQSIIPDIDSYYDVLAEELTALGLPSSLLDANLLLYLFIIMAVFLIVMAIALALYNAFGMKSIHRFAKSLYQSAQATEAQPLMKPNVAANWMLISGIFMGLSALSSLTSFSFLGFLTNGCLVGTYVTAYILMKKYFVK